MSSLAHSEVPLANTQARDELILKNLSCVRQIACSLRRRLPVHVDLDDLIDAGTSGLVAAAAKYDPKKGVPFKTYARHRIRGAMLDVLREADLATREQRRQKKNVARATSLLRAQLKRDPDRAEIASELGITEKRLERILLGMPNNTAVSATEILLDGDESLPRTIPDQSGESPEQLAARQQLRRVLEESMHVLPERYRKLLKLYYIDGLTLKQIGEQMGFRESRASQIHSAALRKLKNVLSERGISSSAEFVVHRAAA